MNDGIHNKILAEIEERHLEPKPRWHFLVHEYGLWLGAGCAGVLGFLAGGIVLYALANSDIEMTSESGLSWVVVTAVAWLVTLVLMVVAVVVSIEHTKRGYRYSLTLISLVAGATLFGVGGSLYALGIVQSLDHHVARAMPWYESIEEQRRGFWNTPEEGRLLGTLVIFEAPDRALLLDVEEHEWHVTLPDRIALPHMRASIAERTPFVVVIGRKVSEDVFEACRIMQWKFRGGEPVWKKHTPEPQAVREFFTKKKEECYRTPFIRSAGTQ